MLEKYAGQTVGILGAGRSGMALAHALETSGAQSIVWDDTQAGQQAVTQAGLRLTDMTQPDFWQASPPALLCVSPGIAHLYPTMHPAIALAMETGVLVDNDISLFLKENTGKIISITGSNGKSTTSTLVHHLLQEGGKAVQLGGNIGNAVFNLKSTDYTVLELSSYQTDLAQYLKTDLAVFLNLSDDHLDRHNGRGGYFAAKERLIAQAKHVIIGVDETEGLFLANRYNDKAVRMSVRRPLRGKTPAIFIENSHITVWDGQNQTHSFSLANAPNLLGIHNWQNACAAVSVALHMGVSTHAIQNGLASYGGLAHRMEDVGTYAGVRYVNDSKATNADAASKALQAYNNILWIAGGVPKEGGITSLLHLLERVKHTYLIGEAAPEFAHTLSGYSVTQADTLERAVAEATHTAQPGDVVLFSPACASFDQFEDFEQRGNAFRRFVHNLHENEDANT